jgi:16S rRNA processing protein RimM
MCAEPLSELLAVGQIKTSHGLKGYLKVKSLSGEFEHLLKLKKVYIGVAGKLSVFEVEDVRAVSGAVLLKLVGIDHRETGEVYRGQIVWAGRRDASPLGDEEYYVVDLQGCQVYHRGDLIGRVVAVPEGSGGEFLEVESLTGERLIIPFSKYFVGRVEVGDRRIELTEEYEIP